MAFLSSKARRSARQDDVSRLLGHPYSPHNKYTAAVKDSYGDFHDPDYRPFTPITKATTRPRSPRRVPSPRPYWETISMTDDDLTNDDDENDDDACDERDLSEGYAYSSRYAHRRSSGQYRRYSANSYSYAQSYSPPSYTIYSYTPSTLGESSYSPPTSYDSDTTVLNKEPFGEKEKQGWSGVLKRRRKEKAKEIENDFEMREEDEDESVSSPMASPPPVPQKPEYVPTCGDIFQRQWQTLCLAFNLSVFRAQRRMKHRVHSLMSTR